MADDSQALATLERTVDRSIDKLKQVPQRAGQSFFDYWQERKRIAGNADLNDEASRRMLGEAKEKAVAELEATEASTRELSQTVTDALDAATAGPALTTEDALLEEIRRQRAWERVRPLIEGQDVYQAVEEVATDAASRNDLATIRALREELPSFLKATGSQALEEVSLKMLSRIELPLLGPAERRAHEYREEFRLGSAYLQTTFGLVRSAIDQGHTSVTVANWDRSVTEFTDQRDPAKQASIS